MQQRRTRGIKYTLSPAGTCNSLSFIVTFEVHIRQTTELRKAIVHYIEPNRTER